ncbi:MAG: pentapeptide repeat-containing protein [Terracidiphilus sp.]|jgi:hypothetical protein
MADEQEITSDESAELEPEIESREGSEQIHEMEPDESTAAAGDSSEAGCPIRMGYGDDSPIRIVYGDDSPIRMGYSDDSQRCGRKLHVAPNGVDELPVCLMHSKDSRKQSGLLYDTFWLEFERILAGAGEGQAHFEYFVFPRLKLNGRIFQAICRFDYAIFSHDADFRFATFTQHAVFVKATFMQSAGFDAASFTQDAFFMYTVFTQDVNFVASEFTQDANFYHAIFTQAACFVYTKFHGTADWRESQFLDQAEFRGTKFEPLEEGEPSAVFVLASTSKPSEIVFDDVDLSRALFHNCDVSQLWFTSSVKWAERDGKRGLAVFEETIDLKHEFAEGLQRYGQRDYRAVAQIYQQLKKNYDSRLNYWTANEFHFGEMEMKRLAGPVGGPFLRLRQWLHRRLSLVALYRYASDYGNSYWKPLLWLLGILALFAALLPLPGVGLKRQGAKQAETYVSAWDVRKSYGENLWPEVRLAGKGVITSVDAATFQRSAEYAPAYPWGRVLAIFETLLTSSLFALFLLAIRRQFRR